MRCSLGLCVGCGYKILTNNDNTPQELRRARKLAKDWKFHFASKPQESCPRYGHDFHTVGKTTSVEVSDPEQIAKEKHIIDAGSIWIRTLIDCTKHARTTAEAF